MGLCYVGCVVASASVLLSWLLLVLTYILIEEAGGVDRSQRSEHIRVKVITASLEVT
jgi:hypothetical protein